MQSVDPTTYQHEAEGIEVIVGDEKQADFHPRVKLKKWDNESNISVGFDDTPDGATVTQEGDKVVFEKEDTIIEAYPLSGDKKKLTTIRRVLNGNHITPVGATAEYEMFNQIGSADEMLLAHYVVAEPSIAVFDLMPAGEHLEVFEENGVVYATDFDYKDKSQYHPNNVLIGSYPKAKVCRFYTPYNTYINPYFMDEGLHNIDIQWKGSSFDSCINELHDAIIEVFAGKGIEIIKAKDLNKQLRQKLYFRHGDRLVKFFSAQEEEKGLYAYINIASAYNKAYDFYRPDVQKDIRNDYAYGIQFAYPEIGHEVVDEIMQLFSKKLNLPLNDRSYSEEENSSWEALQTKHATYDWIAKAERKDSNFVFQEPEHGFELLKKLAAKPDTNEVSLSLNVPKNVVAYYQDELDFKDMFAQGITRKPHIAKSIAIYHPTERNNKYQAGKMAHIYRPFAWDALGTKVACHFKETEGLPDGAEIDLSNGLTIVVPQWFLDEAIYPVTVDPTFGYTTAGGSSTAVLDVIVATEQTSSSSAGNLGAMFFYNTQGTTGSTQIEFALYDGSGNRLSDSGNYTTSAGVTANRWYGLSFSTHPTISPSSTYRLAVTGDGTGGQSGSVSCAYDSTGGKTSYSLAQSYAADSFPADMSGFTTQSSRQYSIYAVTGYQWPIMMGNSTAMAATTRYQPLMVGSATAWSTTIDNQPVINSVDGAVTDLRVDVTTAPGVTTSRAMTIYRDGVASTLAAVISDTATSATDNIGASQFNAGQPAVLANIPTGSPASSTGNKWRMVNTGQYPQWRSTTIAALSTTATRYLGVQDGAGVSTAINNATQIMAPDTGVLQNFSARLVDGTITAGSYTVTLVKNGIDTAAVMTITSQTATYTATTISVTDQDTLYYKIVPSAGTAPDVARRLAVTTEYVSNTIGRGVLLGGANANVSGTTYSIWNNDVWNATEANISALAYQHTIVAARATLSAAPTSTNSRTLTYRKNASGSGTPSITISGASTTGTWSGIYTIATDDLVAIEHSSSGTPANSNMKWGIVFSVAPSTFRAVPVNINQAVKRGAFI